jgi:tetratricopeptide (TPR) repeat protein
MTRVAWLALLCCTGCHSLLVQAPQVARPALSPAVGTVAPPRQQPVEPELHLGRAASLAAQGDQEAAAEELRQYVALRPEHLMARVQLAEMLFRLDRHEEARLHYELFIALAQDHGEAAVKHLIHCHSRLVEIAESHNDAYEEHLNRGIGLWLLSRAPGALAEGLSQASLLYRAAAELQAARAEQPDEARPHYYLYLAWKDLGQHTPALRSLEAADRHALVSRMTPKERRELQTCCVREADRLRSGP